MTLAQKTSLSLLMVSLGAIPATAAFPGDAASGGVSIESSSSASAHQSFDELLGGGNHEGLFDSILQKHAKAAHPAKSIMEGNYEGDGSAQPAGLPSQGASSPYSESPQAPNHSPTVAAHQGSQGESNPASASSPSSTPPTAKIVAQGENAPALLTPLTPLTPLTTFTYTSTITPIAPANDLTYSTTITPISPVPLPAAGLLLASGLIGMAGMRKRTQSE
jgi:hypothetical protein